MYKVTVVVSTLMVGGGAVILADGAGRLSYPEPVYSEHILQDLKAIESARYFTESSKSINGNTEFSKVVENARDFVASQEARQDIIFAREKYNSEMKEYANAMDIGSLEVASGFTTTFSGLVAGLIAILSRKPSIKFKD